MRLSCRVAGIVGGAKGLPTRAGPLSGSGVSPAASSTALVSSSTNSGTPSALATICCRTASGSARPPATASARAALCRRGRRFSEISVACGRPFQGGGNSGRKVSSSSTRSPAIRPTSRSSSSSVVGSAQCRSSNTHSTGCLRARPATCSTRTSIVASLCRCGAAVERRVAPLRAGWTGAPRSAVPPRSPGPSPGPAGPRACPAWRPAYRPAGSRRPAPGARSSGGAPCRRSRASTGGCSRSVRLALEPLAEGAGDAGLADPGLAREQHHLALAVAGLLPAVEQERDLLLAPDQRRQAGRARLETAADRALAEHAPRPHRRRRSP